MSNRKLSEQELETLHTIMLAIEARLKNGAEQGGITAEGVKFTIFYMLKWEQ